MIGNVEDLKKYCKEYENIENYEVATFSPEVWECHHRLETNFSDGTLRPKKAQLNKKELIALNMYWNRPSNELIFLSKKDHCKIHRTNSLSIDYGSSKKDKKAYMKAYKKTSTEKSRDKVNHWASSHNYPEPSKAKFPNKWNDEDKQEYIRQFNNYNK